MGDEDMGEAAAFQRALQRFDMLGQIRAGIDDRRIAALPHDVDAGALEGERARDWARARA